MHIASLRTVRPWWSHSLQVLDGTLEFSTVAQHCVTFGGTSATSPRV